MTFPRRIATRLRSQRVCVPCSCHLRRQQTSRPVKAAANNNSPGQLAAGTGAGVAVCTTVGVAVGRGVEYGPDGGVKFAVQRQIPLLMRSSSMNPRNGQ